MKSEDFLSFLEDAAKLKDTIRHVWTPKGRNESVPEHTWRAMLMAFALEDELDIDMNKVIRMLLIHDMGEAFDGDIPAFEEYDKDEKHRSEMKAISRFASQLPDGKKQELLALWNEFESKETPEARFAQAMDKMEVLISHLECDLKHWVHEEYELQFTHGKELMSEGKLAQIRKLIDERSREKINDT